MSGQGREHRSEERARSGAPRGSESVTPSSAQTYDVVVLGAGSAGENVAVGRIEAAADAVTEHA